MSDRTEYIKKFIRADMKDRFSPIMGAICRLQGQDPFDDSFAGANMRIYFDAVDDVVAAEESVGDAAARYPDDALAGAVLRAVEKKLGKSAALHFHEWAGSIRN